MKQQIIQTIKAKGFCLVHVDDWNDAQELVTEGRIVLQPERTAGATFRMALPTANLTKPVQLKFTEERLLEAFRYMRQGGKVRLGVKSPWWAIYCVPEYPDTEIRFIDLWKPSAIEIAFYEKLLCECFMKLSELDRRLLISRFGSGKKVGLRKCASDYGTNHEAFRQQIQVVIKS